MLDLAGRIAVITGGSGALGLAVAKELNGLGAHVILLGRSSDKLNEAISQIDSTSGSSSFYACDVSNEDSLAQAAEQIFSIHSSVDILVTCAAAPAAGGKFEESSLDEWHSLLSTDLDGVYLACRIFGKSMINQYLSLSGLHILFYRWGRIIVGDSTRVLPGFSCRSYYFLLSSRLIKVSNNRLL